MRQHPRRARTDPTAPRAWGTDDRSGFVGNHQDLQWQHEWAGTKLVNKRVLVYPDMLDQPNEQLRTIRIPTDPPSLLNARPEQYSIDENPGSNRITLSGKVRVIGVFPNWSIRIIQSTTP